MPIIPPIAPAPTIQIFIRWFLITKGDWSAHRSRAGYPVFCRGALASRLVQDRGEARDEKSVLNKLRVDPDFVFSPPLRSGVAVSPSCEGCSPSPPLAKGVHLPPPCEGCSLFPPLRRGGRGGGARALAIELTPPTSREGCRRTKRRGHEGVLNRRRQNRKA